MPRQKPQAIHGFPPMEEDTTKIRKRGCSPTSSSSSIIQNYRFKRAVLVGKRGIGSSTPVPTWRIMASRSPSIALRAAAAAETPRSQSGKSTRGATQPVSARKLAATLWEINKVSMPRTAAEGRGGNAGRKKGANSSHLRREKGNSSVSGFSLPSHLSDPSHSPRSDRSGIGNNQRRHRQSSSGRRLSATAVDSASNASFMEIESRSRCHPTGSGIMNNRLEDVSSALTTSKELLKIIKRIRSHEDHRHHQSSSSASLISALNTELERASLQVNQLIQEQQRSDSQRSDISTLLKQFEWEKAAWKDKEREAVEVAVESVVGELEAEKKLRRRVDSLNKRLGMELAETKEKLSRAMNEIESEKRARGEVERVCDELEWELGRGSGGDVVDLEGSYKKGDGMMMRRGREEADDDRETEMLQVVDLLREERAQGMKHHSEAGDQLRNELKDFTRTKGSIEKAHYRARCGGGSFEREISTAVGEVECGTEDDGEGSGESDLHSIELLNDINRRRDYKLNGAYMSSPRRPPRSSCSRRLQLISEVEDVKGRKSVYSSTGGGKDHYHRGGRGSLLRSMSVVGFGSGSHSQNSPHRAHVDFDAQQQHRRSFDHDLQRYKSVKGLREQILSSYKNKDTASPARKWG